MLEQTGRFEVRVNEEPLGCTEATFEYYDTIVLNFTNYMLRYGPPWPEATRTALLHFVKSGKGLVAYHGSLSAFAEWPEYEEMTGGAWRQDSAHAPYHTFSFKIVDNESPITRGLLPEYTQSDEISHGLRMQKDAHLLATAFDDPANCTNGNTKSCGSGKEEPVAWVHRYGDGRVFTTLLGHDLKSIGSPGFTALFVRAVEWVATGSVTIKP
jgi:type 1 glutamine amidotransferase